ncbi:MAG: hypothetical protein ABFQ65_03680 [Nanoarchaeota archaeon]
MKISDKKKEKISEQIILFLYLNNPKSFFTSYIAQEIARDEEFTKLLLINLKKRKLVIEIKKNSKGVDYIRRSRWKLSESSYNIYKYYQN